MYYNNLITNNNSVGKKIMCHKKSITDNNSVGKKIEPVQIQLVKNL